MARVSTPPILSQIRSARSYPEQNAAIRSLKNEIIGHLQKQQKWVELGVLEPIVQILAASRSPARLNGKDTRGHTVSLKPLSEEEAVRLQAIQLLASFANGGPSFLTPLHATGSLPALLSNLCPIDNHPRIVFATLRALTSIADAATFVLPPHPVEPTLLADEIFVPQHLDSLCSILSFPGSHGNLSPGLINVAATLVSSLCREERHQIALASSGVLDALATRLASFVVARGQVVPLAEVLSQNEGLAEAIPEPAPSGASLTAVLDAVASVIADSRLRACMLLYSPAILAVFPSAEFTPPAARDAVRAAWNALDSVSLSSSRPQTLGAMDYLLPVVACQSKSSAPPQVSPFPPLGATRDSQRSGPLSFSGFDSSRLDQGSPGGEGGAAEDPEVPLIPWLINLARSSTGVESLVAASVLTSLYKAGFASRSREAAMGFLIVPLLVHALADKEGDAAAAVTSAWVDTETATRWAVVERALTVLARLITDSEYLAKAAFECNAIKVICKLLKEAYERLPVHDTLRPWSATRRDEGGRAGAGLAPEAAASCCLGPRGQPPLHRHRIRLRECALKALAALISAKEDYRKALVEQDAMSCIAESLAESPGKPQANGGGGGGGSSRERPSSSNPVGGSPSLPSESPRSSAYGRNSVQVLIAACHTVRVLTRSVSVMRTSLQDAGVAIPLFNLLRHPDVDVQVAATGVICNLTTEFSPMREKYLELGIVKILCEHAHSMNAPLRLNALWALKHLVDGLRTDMKKACLDELQSGWLVQLICDDTEDDALFIRTESDRQAAAAAAAAAAVAHSAVAEDMDEDVEMDQLEEEHNINIGNNSNNNNNNNGGGNSGGGWPYSSAYGSASPKLSHERSRTGRLRYAETKLAALREAELNPVRKARIDDLAIQEQGLNFIRNLITATNQAPSSGSLATQDTTEMIDYLFSELGQDRLFGILASKLRSKTLHPFSRRFSSSSGVAGNGSSNNNNNNNNNNTVSNTKIINNNSNNNSSSSSSSSSNNNNNNNNNNNITLMASNTSRVLYPQTKVIEAVVCILVHMAASVPRHRQLVVSQTELLRSLMAHFGSRDKDVRVALCQLASNLTWSDDDRDAGAAADRAAKLESLGMGDRLRQLQLDDCELDVRERAKAAVWQIKQAQQQQQQQTTLGGGQPLQFGSGAGAAAAGNH